MFAFLLLGHLPSGRSVRAAVSAPDGAYTERERGIVANILREVFLRRADDYLGVAHDALRGLGGRNESLEDDLDEATLEFAAHAEAAAVALAAPVPDWVEDILGAWRGGDGDAHPRGGRLGRLLAARRPAAPTGFGPSAELLETGVPARPSEELAETIREAARLAPANSHHWRQLRTFGAGDFVELDADGRAAADDLLRTVYVREADTYLGRALELTKAACEIVNRNIVTLCPEDELDLATVTFARQAQMAAEAIGTVAPSWAAEILAAKKAADAREEAALAARRLYVCLAGRRRGPS